MDLRMERMRELWQADDLDDWMGVSMVAVTVEEKGNVWVWLKVEEKVAQMVDGMELRRVDTKVVEMTATMVDSWGKLKVLQKVAWTFEMTVVTWAQVTGL